MTTKTNARKPWIVLICLSLMFAAQAGIINNSIGVFYSPVSESLNILRGSFAFHATLKMIATGIVGLATPQLINKFGWKKIIVTGTILVFIGTAGMAFTERLSIFYLLGAIRGVGAGISGMIPFVMIINNWFHAKNGLAISIASAFSGLIGLIFAPVFSAIIAHFSWEIGFISMGVIIVLFNLPAIIYPYHLNPEEDNALPYGYKKPIKDTKTSRVNGVEHKQTLKSVAVSFVALLLFSVLFTTVVGMNQHFASFGETIGMSLQASGYMLSAVMLGNFTFKLIKGSLSDHYGAVTATIITIGINSLGLFILVVSESAILAIFAAFLFGSGFGLGSISLPLLSNQFFGRKLATQVYPKLTFAMLMGAAVSNTVVGYIYDFTGSYQSIFVIALFIQVTNVLVLFIAYKFSLKRRT